ATQLYRESLQLGQELGEKTTMIECLERLAGVFAAQGRPLLAGEFFGAADHLRSVHRTPLRPTDRLHYERRLAVARAALDDARWRGAGAAGRRLSLDAAVTQALATRTAES